MAKSIAELTEKQIEAIEVLSKGWSITDTAKNAGVSRASIYRWLEQDHFQEALEAAILIERNQDFMHYCRKEEAKVREGIALLEAPDTPTEQRIDVARKLLRGFAELWMWNDRQYDRI